MSATVPGYWTVTLTALRPGAVIADVWTRLHRKSGDKFIIPVASGLIAGESLMAAVLAIMATIAGLLAAGNIPK